MKNETVKVGSIEMTREQAEKAGCLPEQIRARNLRTVAALERLGRGKGGLATHLRARTKGEAR